jgi:hypothetical protein
MLCKESNLMMDTQLSTNSSNVPAVCDGLVRPELGNALEIIAVEDIDRDCLVVIHAMKLRKQFYHLLEGGNRGL